MEDEEAGNRPWRRHSIFSQARISQLRTNSDYHAWPCASVSQMLFRLQLSIVAKRDTNLTGLAYEALCWWFVEHERTWVDRKKLTAKGSALAYFDSKEEFNLFTSAFGDEKEWPGIKWERGFRSGCINRPYFNADEKEQKWFNWNGGEPNNASHRGGRWGRYSSSPIGHFIYHKKDHNVWKIWQSGLSFSITKLT